MKKFSKTGQKYYPPIPGGVWFLTQEELDLIKCFKKYKNYPLFNGWDFLLRLKSMGYFEGLFYDSVSFEEILDNYKIIENKHYSKEQFEYDIIKSLHPNYQHFCPCFNDWEFLLEMQKKGYFQEIRKTRKLIDILKEKNKKIKYN